MTPRLMSGRGEKREFLNSSRGFLEILSTANKDALSKIRNFFLDLRAIRVIVTLKLHYSRITEAKHVLPFFRARRDGRAFAEARSESGRFSGKRSQDRTDEQRRDFTHS